MPDSGYVVANRDGRELITPLPGAHTLKPGSASRAFFGVDPVILRMMARNVTLMKAESCASESRGRE